MNQLCWISYFTWMQSDFITLCLRFHSFSIMFVNFIFIVFFGKNHRHSIPPYDYMAILHSHLILEGRWDFPRFWTLKILLNIKNIVFWILRLYILSVFWHMYVYISVGTYEGWSGWGKDRHVLRSRRYCQWISKVVVLFSLFLIVFIEPSYSVTSPMVDIVIILQL